MKRRVRLTESDLHRIVKESVNQVLTELDWKTYMNAAKARQAQGKSGKASDLEAYSNQQFQKKHFGNNWGYTSHEDVSPSNDTTVNALLRGNVNMNGGYMRDERDYTSPMYGNTIKTPYGDYKEMIGRTNLAGGTAHHAFGKNYTKNDTGYGMIRIGGNGDNGKMLNRVSNDYKNKITSVGNDLNGYYNGQSKYVKGKGWQ